MASISTAISKASGSTTEIVRPTGQHKYTIVFLHQLGQDAKSCAQVLRNLPYSNVKWICPQGPHRPLSILHGNKNTAWFNMGEPTEECRRAPHTDVQWFNMGPYSEENGPGFIEGLDESAKLVTDLLSQEHNTVKLGVGGFGIGFATALYTATCYALQKYGNGVPYNRKVKLDVVCGINGWLPCPSFIIEMFNRDMEAIRRAKNIRISMSHEYKAVYVPVDIYTLTATTLNKIGFKPNFIDYLDGEDHFLTREHMKDICEWIKEIRSKR